MKYSKLFTPLIQRANQTFKILFFLNFVKNALSQVQHVRLQHATMRMHLMVYLVLFKF